MQSLIDAALAKEIAPFMGDQLLPILLSLLLVVILLISPNRGVALEPAR